MPKTASDTQRVSAQVCAVEGCVHAELHARGMCDMHYKRWLKHSDPQDRAWRPQSNDGPCAVEDCASPAMARGFCNKHYQRLRTHGDPLKVAPPGGRPRVKLPCMVDGCEGEPKARGYCNKHYHRWRRHGDPRKMAQPKTADSPLCREDFGSRIKAARVAAGLTQWAVAGGAGVSVRTVVQVEQGHRTNPRHSTLKGFAGALGIPLSELLARPDSTAL